jgi:tetratricopeptide (TPR) repeat protein
MAVIHFIFALLFFAAPPVISSSHEPGDREFSRMNYFRAVALYDSVLAISADSAVVLWRIARAWTCIADTATPENKLELYKQARAFARRAVRADSMNSEAHTWLAIAIGNIAMFEGGQTKVRLCRVIKKELDIAIKLDSCNDVAYSILGSFYKALGDVSWVEKQLATLFLGGLPDGGYKESDAAFRKAIELAPDVIRNHYELGKVYMSQDRNREALTEFRKVLLLPLFIGMDLQMKNSAYELATEMEN